MNKERLLQTREDRFSFVRWYSTIDTVQFVRWRGDSLFRIVSRKVKIDSKFDRW